MIKVIVKELSRINLCLKFQLDNTTLVTWAKYIEEKVEDVDIKMLSDVVDMYLFGKIVWNQTAGIQNILIPLTRYKKVECLEDYYEALPNGCFFYRGYEYRPSEWDAFINMRWNDFHRKNSWSKDSLFIKAIATLEMDLSDIEAREGEFVNQQAFNELKQLIKTIQQ